MKMILKQLSLLTIFFYLLCSLVLINNVTFAQKARVHHIPPAPWQYWSDANEIILTTQINSPVNVVVKKSDLSALNTLTVNSSSPTVYRFSGSPNGIVRHPLNTIIKGAGLIVEATNDIYVNVRNVASDEMGAGVDQFIKGNASMVSMGDQGVGLKFRVGYYRSDFSSIFDGGPIYSILAMNDNTIVKLNGTPFVTLNAGDSYLFQANMGSLIESSLPITMISGASIDAPGGCGDGVFDQIPPLSVLGNQYLIIRGNGTAGINSVYPEQTTIVATQDNTVVEFKNYTPNGVEIIPAPAPISLNAGQFYTFFHGDASNVYSSTSINSNKHLVVYSGSANGCEVDMSTVPPISSCTGSTFIQTFKFRSYSATDLPYLGFIIIQDATTPIFFNGNNIESLTGTRIALGATGSYLLKFDNSILGNPSNITIESAKKLTVSFIQLGGGFSMSSYFSLFNDIPDLPTIQNLGCGKVVLTAESNLFPYQWYLNDTLIPNANNQKLTASEVGNYSYTGTKSCGITATSAPVNVSFIKSLLLRESHSIFNCKTNTSNVTISATGGSSPFIGVGSFIQTLPSQKYFVTDANGCKDSIVVNLTINTPSVELGPDKSICKGDPPVNLGIPASNDLIYKWTSSVSISNPEQSQISVSPSDNTKYFLTATDKSTGCETKDDITVKVTPLPVLKVDTTGICPGGNTVLNVSGASDYVWSPAPQRINTSNGSSVTVAPASTTAYEITGRQLPSGCSSKTKTTVTVHPLPQGNISVAGNVNFICEGSSVILTASGGSAYQWYLNNALLQGATTSQLEAKQTGTYSVELTSPFGCKNRTASTPAFSLIQKPTADFRPPFGCVGNPISFTNISQTAFAGPVRYDWDLGGGASSTQVNPTFIYSSGGAYNVKLTITPTQCPQLAQTVSKIVLIEKARDGMRYNDVNTLINTNTSLSARPFGNQYLWEPSVGLNNYTIARPLFNYDKDTEYTIRIGTASGCETVDTVRLRMFNSSDIYVPSAFSPNGDGANDRLDVFLVGIKELIMFRVFNRWGQLLFETSDPRQLWDGKFKNVEQPLETYVWIAEARDYNGQIIKKRGQTILIR